MPEPVVLLHEAPTIEVHADGSSSHAGRELDARLLALAAAFVEVNSISDPMDRAVRAQRLFGKAATVLFGREPAPWLQAEQLAKAFHRAIEGTS